MQDFQVTWEFVGFVVATISAFGFSGVGVLLAVRAILKEVQANPVILRLAESAATSLPAEQATDIVEFMRDINEKWDFLVNNVFDLISENIQIATNIAEEVFDGIPADQK